MIILEISWHSPVEAKSSYEVRCVYQQMDGHEVKLATEKNRDLTDYRNIYPRTYEHNDIGRR